MRKNRYVKVALVWMGAIVAVVVAIVGILREPGVVSTAWAVGILASLIPISGLVLFLIAYFQTRRDERDDPTRIADALRAQNAEEAPHRLYRCEVCSVRSIGYKLWKMNAAGQLICADCYKRRFGRTPEEAGAEPAFMLLPKR